MGAELAIPDPKQSGPEILVFPEDATKGDIIYELSQRIPQNEFGLPDFFFRSDLIHGTQLTDQDVDAAAVGLFYFNGYPTLENGSSFWNQLPHEPQKQYEMFTAYLDQAGEIGIRQLDLLAVHTDFRVEELSEFSREFFWSARARAYDLFITAAEAKKRQHRIRKMEDKHFVETDKMFTKLLQRFTGEFDDWIEELNAKEAIEALELLVKIQRMSVGLTGQHASSTSRDIPAGVSDEDAIRRLAQSSGMSHSNADQFAGRLQHLLNHPEEGATLQAAIISYTAPNNRTQFDEDLAG
jgi:hypothetical protein